MCDEGANINPRNGASTAAELRKSLYAVFGQFGKILDVVCLKTYRMRGQAWIVFSDVISATNALHAMQRFPFFNKPMVCVKYAKEVLKLLNQALNIHVVCRGSHMPRQNLMQCPRQMGPS